MSARCELSFRLLLCFFECLPVPTFASVEKVPRPSLLKVYSGSGRREIALHVLEQTVDKLGLP